MTTGRAARDRPRPRWRRWLRLARLALLCGLAALASYFVAALVLGLIPVNAGWRPAVTGTPIHVWSNGVHTDLVLPARSPARDWTAVVPLANGWHAGVQQVRFGWGDRGFYLQTPTWADLRIGVAANALLLPSAAVMHVVYEAAGVIEDERCVRVLLSDRQMATLVARIDASLRRDAMGAPQRIGAGYGSFDEFWEATGSYHLFYTCNSWTNAALAEIGVRTAVWAPFDWAILCHLR